MKHILLREGRRESYIFHTSYVDGSEIQRENQLRLVLYPSIYRVSYIPGGAAFFHQQCKYIYIYFTPFCDMVPLTFDYNPRTWTISILGAAMPCLLASQFGYSKRLCCFKSNPHKQIHVITYTDIHKHTRIETHKDIYIYIFAFVLNILHLFTHTLECCPTKMPKIFEFLSAVSPPNTS